VRCACKPCSERMPLQSAPAESPCNLHLQKDNPKPLQVEKAAVPPLVFCLKNAANLETRLVDAAAAVGCCDLRLCFGGIGSLEKENKPQTKLSPEPLEMKQVPGDGCSGARGGWRTRARARRC